MRYRSASPRSARVDSFPTTFACDSQYRDTIRQNRSRPNQEGVEMTINTSVLQLRHMLGVSGVLFLLFASTGITVAQNEPEGSGNWWTVSAEGSRESGKLSEILIRKKVYIVTSFTDSRTISEPSPTLSSDVRR